MQGPIKEPTRHRKDAAEVGADQRVDLVVVGAGHAGVEAAIAAARMGLGVALVTNNTDAVARMSCNPAVGGLGKGHLVREVDALGGMMGLCADATAIQFRRLNRRKGAAVRGTRVQSDAARYSQWMGAAVRAEPRVQLVGAEVADIELERDAVSAVHLADGARIRCRAVVLTTGTFLRGQLHVGDETTPGGRRGEPAAVALAHALARIGLRMGRLKTGTPARLDKKTIDFNRLEPQPGDDPPPRLSAWSHWPDGRPPLPQLPCHITYTNARTHQIIRDNLARSAVFSGAISGNGPRYCPSIEDKVVRFADRERHQIFVEPLGLDSDLYYPNGISTSLPRDAQQALIASIAGFEHARVVRFGYAVEYDYADPRQLDASLALRGVRGLYLAGQINGTTGYEEAAAQGLMAGINAALAAREREPLVLGRDRAYIGVLVDDLVTRGVGAEPYRMFTSRAELRLLLREDNAEERLAPIGRELGLLDDARWRLFCERREHAERLRGHLEQTRVRGDDGALDALLVEAGTVSARAGSTLVELMQRPQVGLSLLSRAGLVPADPFDTIEPLVREKVEIAIKYAAYIDKQREQAERLAALEGELLPDDLDYDAIVGLRNEAREKLARARPRSIGQAARIPGITPAAVALLHVHLSARRRRAARPRAHSH